MTEQCRCCDFWSPIPATEPGGHCLAARQPTIKQPEDEACDKFILRYSEELKRRGDQDNRNP